MTSHNMSTKEKNSSKLVAASKFKKLILAGSGFALVGSLLASPTFLAYGDTGVEYGEGDTIPERVKNEESLIMTDVYIVCESIEAIKARTEDFSEYELKELADIVVAAKDGTTATLSYLDYEKALDSPNAKHTVINSNDEWFLVPQLELMDFDIEGEYQKYLDYVYEVRETAKPEREAKQNRLYGGVAVAGVAAIAGTAYGVARYKKRKNDMEKSEVEDV